MNALELAAVVTRDESLRRELLVYSLRIGVVLVDLVDGDDDRDLRGPRVMDGLDRLRHHPVVGRHHEHDEVGDLRASGAHGGERLVAGSVDEHHLVPVGGLDLIGADPLRDPTGLACRHTSLADGVEDRSLAVVDVAEDGHDRRSCHELAWVLVGDREQLLARGGDYVAGALRGLDGDHILALDRLHRETELVGHDLCGGEVDDLVDGGQDLGRHQLLDDLYRAHAQLLGQVLDRKRRRQDSLAVAVGLDLDRYGGRLEGRAGSLDRARRQWRRGVLERHPSLLEEVHQLFLADPEFACEFV